MEHLTYELNSRRLVWIGFFEVHDETKRAILERSICRTNDDSIPGTALDAQKKCEEEVTNQVMTLSVTGDAETPAGGSVCIRLKSRINRRRAVVDMMRKKLMGRKGQGQSGRDVKPKYGGRCGLIIGNV